MVGLPNVGKSTLFNALTKTAAAQAANFPFCTIEPNVGEVGVPDDRLDTLAAIASSKQIIPTRMTFVDIAGLVKGASKGEGLGNQFLANIREVDAIAHVLRCFEDGDVTHVEGRVDPVADAETIETELMLADLESIEKRLQNIVRKVRGGDKEAMQQQRLMEAAKSALEDGKPARVVDVDEEDAKAWSMLQLLTSKPVLYVCNVAEDEAAEGNAQSARVAEMAAAPPRDLPAVTLGPAGDVDRRQPGAQRSRPPDPDPLTGAPHPHPPPSPPASPLHRGLPPRD